MKIILNWILPQFINMVEVIKNMVNYVLDKKYPGMVNHVNVTVERDMNSYYTDEDKNYLYNIFIDMDRTDMRLDVVILVENTLKTMGISNRVAFYWG